MAFVRDGNKFVLTIDSLADGLSYDIFAGGENQFALGTRDIDFFTRPGIISPVRELNRPAGPAMETRAAKAILDTSTGTIYAAATNASSQLSIGTTSTAGGYSETDADAGEDAIDNGSKFIEWKDYLWFYHAAGTELGKFGDITGSPTITISATGTLTGNVGFDLLATKSFLYYCNKNNVGRATDASTFNDTALTLDGNIRVRTLTAWQNSVVVGGDVLNGGDYSRLYLWDGVSSNIERQPIIVPDSGLRAVVNNGGILYIFCVSNPNGGASQNSIKIYAWSGGDNVQLVREIDLENTSTNSFTVYPAAVDVYKGKVYFGVSAATANTMNIDNGIYSLDRRGVLNLEYVSSADSSDTSDVNIFFAKWMDGRLWTLHLNGANTRFSVQGQDYADSKLNTLAYRFDPRRKSIIKRVRFGMKGLPASTSIVLGEDVDQQGSFTTVKTFDTDGDTIAKVEGGTEYKFQPGDTHQLQFTFSSENAGSSGKADIILPIVIEGEILEDKP